MPTVASFLAAVLAAPGLSGLGFRVHSGRNAHLIEALRGHEIDAAIGRLSDPDAMAGVSFEPLYAEPMLVALRPGHRLDRPGAAVAPTAAELSSYPLVLPPAGTLIRQIADGFIARHGIAVGSGIVETLDTAFARALVLHGDHLWFTPAGAVLADVAAGTLARLPQAIVPDEAVGLMPRSDARPEPRLAGLVAAVRDAAAARRRG